jgi:hypothetical protein
MKKHQGFFRVFEEDLRKIESTFDSPSAKRKAFAAWIAVLRIANLEGSETFTRNIGSLAFDMSFSYRHAQDALVLLERSGLLQIVRKKIEGTKENAPSVYTLLQNGRTLEQKVTRLLPTENSELFREYPRTYQEPPKTSKNPSSNDEEGAENEDKDFDQFWNLYPKNVGKKDARKAWSASSKTRPPIQELLDSLKKQANSEQWKKDKGKFVPHPKTWLNGERWNDEVTVSTKPEGGIRL